MPIKITINGEEILAEKIEISEFNINIIPFQGCCISGELKMEPEEFQRFQDVLVQWAESAASSSQ